MTRIAPKYDSAHSQEKCTYCFQLIDRRSDRVIIGTGNTLLASYHTDCWILTQETKDPSPAAEPGKGDPSY